ncbi:hypothetical protein [Bradyrhizobium uaiense]|uniref:hypothetical protein n=1 Tax=Bradyrhizobium uaiense TaxID=2594946 RepID=UPI0013D7ADDB|nr:hypothetical protein [Bradyrhizobium uaiense]
MSYALLDTFAHEEPHGSGFCTFLQSKVEEAYLGRTILIIPIELAERMVSVAAIGIDEPEVGLPENDP